jgi:hypothetical protein
MKKAIIAAALILTTGVVSAFTIATPQNAIPLLPNHQLKKILARLIPKKTSDRQILKKISVRLTNCSTFAIVVPATNKKTHQEDPAHLSSLIGKQLY